MFPMIADVSEFKTARSVVYREVERLTRMGAPMPKGIKVGSMLEVPSLAWQLDTLLPLADFISIGSSDLLQFFFAFDRNNPALAGRYDIFAPSALSFVKSIIDKCHQHETPVSLCGEMAGRPLVAMALVGLGLRSLSVPASAVGPIKTMIRSLDVGALTDYLGTMFGSADHSVQGKLREFAQDHRVVL
jgi:phosphotransferase system enzyme I (PtsP)